MSANYDEAGKNTRNKVIRGAASELVAATHLMRQGYHVFRALSASCPVDMVAWRDGEAPLRVEVKSGCWQQRKPGGAVHHTYIHPVNDEWDLLLIVDPSDRVHAYRATEFPTYTDVVVDYRAACAALYGSLSPVDLLAVPSGPRVTEMATERRTA